MKELSVTLQTLQSEKQQLTEDDQEMIKQRAKLEFDVKDLEESLENDVNSRVSFSFFPTSMSFSLPTDHLFAMTCTVCRITVRES